MEFKLTTDHEEIRSWIDQHRGIPAIRTKKGRGRGVIDICFDELDPDMRAVSWEEFFDTFDTLGMTFRYENAHSTPRHFLYSFISCDESPDDEQKGESGSAMPEDDVPIENVISSAPASPSPDSINNTMTYT